VRAPLPAGDAMIVMDSPRIDVFRGRRVTTAHLVSTLPGRAGTEELVAFARGIGMDPAWIQHPGEPREHFDLLGVARCNRAHRACATVDRRTLGLTISRKRALAQGILSEGPFAGCARARIVATAAEVLVDTGLDGYAPVVGDRVPGGMVPRFEEPWYVGTWRRLYDEDIVRYVGRRSANDRPVWEWTAGVLDG